MDPNIISKYRLFGRAGKILMTVLFVIAVIAAVIGCAATAFVAALPQNALTVSVTERAEFRFENESFGKLWNILGGRFTYSGKDLPGYMQKNGSNNVMPPEDAEFGTELKFFNRTYDSARITADGGEKVMEAESAAAEYNVKDLTLVFGFAALSAAAAAVSLWMLRCLFAVLTKCESPFCGEVVAKMRGFAFSLLPVAVTSSVAGTMLERFLGAGRSHNVTIAWGVLIAFAVTMALVAVFRDGVQLQKESDETL